MSIHDGIMILSFQPGVIPASTIMFAVFAWRLCFNIVEDGVTSPTAHKNLRLVVWFVFIS